MRKNTISKTICASFLILGAVTLCGCGSKQEEISYKTLDGIDKVTVSTIDFVEMKKPEEKSRLSGDEEPVEGKVDSLVYIYGSTTDDNAIIGYLEKDTVVAIYDRSLDGIWYVIDYNGREAYAWTGLVSCDYYNDEENQETTIDTNSAAGIDATTAAAEETTTYYTPAATEEQTTAAEETTVTTDTEETTTETTTTQETSDTSDEGGTEE